MTRTVFRAARIHTMDGPPVEALAVEGGKIVARGDLADMPAWSRIDLDGVVVPGFNDAHVHVYKVGHLLTSMIDLRGVDSMAALQARLCGAAGDGWLQGRGFNEASMAGRKMPDRHDLDVACPDRPVLLTRTCGHIAVANTMALRLARVTATTIDPKGGAVMRDAHGEPTGVLRETAMGLVSGRIPLPTADEYEAMILAAARRHLAMGITSASEAGVTLDILEVYRRLEARGALPYRVNVMALRRPLGHDVTLPLPERFVSDFLRVDTVKLIGDGGLSGATAALRAPYRHLAGGDGCCGLLRLDADGLVELSADAVAAGLRLAVHAIGDAAIDACLDAFERLGPMRLAPRIEHLGLPDAAQLARARALGVVAVPQPIFVKSLGVNFRAYLPGAMLSRAYPLRSMLEAGLVTALSSDAPVVADERPLLGIASAVLRCDDEGVVIAPEQAVDAETALRGYTLGGALASGDDGNRGRLGVGMWADLAVLSEDPLAVAPERLPLLDVWSTWVGGVRAEG